MTNDAEIRKYKSHIKISGVAVIVFGLWGFIRLFIYISLNQELLTDIMQNSDAEVSITAIKIILYCLCAFICAVDICVRVIIGKNAIHASHEKNVKPAYIYIAAIYLSVTLIADIISIINVTEYEFNLFFSSIIIDFTSNFALLDVIVSSIRLRNKNKNKNKAVINSGG